MSMTWTEEQKQVIEARGGNLLVSAAAGSGKTAVLVERILSLITDPEHPVDVDRLLVTTFTKAAAGELKERISRALGERLLREPENEWLQRQEALVGRAQITTIHGFCLYVIRNYFHTIGLNPNFRIADEGEMQLMKADTAEEIVEEALKEKEPGVLRFAESYGSGHRGGGLEELILQLYEYAIACPQPVKWLRMHTAAYALPEGASWSEIPGSDVILGELRVVLQELIQQIREARRIAVLPGGPAPYDDVLQADELLLKELLGLETLEQYEEAMQDLKFQRLPSRRSKAMAEADEDLIEQAAALRNSVKDSLKKLAAAYFSLPGELAAEQMRGCAENASVYTELTIRFMKRLEEKKRQKNLLDFSDQEHLALRILTHEQDGELRPTEVASLLSDYFAEIMVDEYQDSNLVQEAILESISGHQKGRDNRFMVGDVKQSIYRFRQAEPGLFLDKYDRYLDGAEGRRIDLHQNFRSRPEVLAAANEVFYKLMRRELGGIQYDEAAALRAGAAYPGQPGFCAELLLLSQEEWEEERKESHWTKQEAEAHLIAGRIRELLKTGKVTESGELRSVDLSDIVILLRTMSGWSETFVRVLQDEGIPASAQTRDGYFETMEVETLLAYLKILDNPTQEIPLAAALHGMLGRFSSKELAVIKSAYGEESFGAACTRYAKEQENELSVRLRSFFRRMKEYRRRAFYTSIHELLWQIVTETGFLNEVRALPSGAQRLANVEMLLQKAQDYEKISYHGLFHFIRYIEKLQKYSVDFGEAAVSSEQGQAVRIMSIHHSKGLEFPVVFVAGLGKPFNKQDSRARMAFHNRYGIGMDYVDLENRMKMPTALKQLIRRQNQMENLAEELRILYVAMTRAREKLILTGMAKEQLLEELPPQGAQLPVSKLTGAQSALEWILMALPTEGSAALRRRVPVRELTMKAVQKQVETVLTKEEMKREIVHGPVEPGLLEELDRCLLWEYPWDLSGGGKQKYSVTELKKLSMQEEQEGSEELYSESDIIPLVPQFIERTEGKTGAERGTVYHTIMESMDFDGLHTVKQVRERLQALADSGRIEQEDIDAVYFKDFLVFAKTDLCRRMLEAKKKGMLYREQPFVIELEQVLIQGIIDAFFYEDDEIVVLDYKTDRVGSGKELAEKYHIQLDYYQKALEMMTGKRVKERLIYSFTLNETISL